MVPPAASLPPFRVGASTTTRTTETTSRTGEPMSDVVEQTYEFMRSIQGRVIEYATEHDAEFGERQGELLRDLLAEVERLRAEKLGLEISESNLVVQLRNEVERLRPRVIDTTADLEWLPENSVILTHDGGALQKTSLGSWYWANDDQDEILPGYLIDFLPARVLYIPEAE
ncbi:hypothetical protein TAJ_54 [Mycobacterium phage Taj]|uniref:Uncharacterized protein n=3 Tax=Cheoctovirus TaxID=1623281 RepID=E7EJS0_9CAUD|nr:hypothetical protein PBI_WEE_53 [Mycobacterium phage Wee]YP_009016946.1 hypothetical protein CM05_gp056 [Mycobacterium phage DeadP]YP_009100166.1 hypothetical protein TAJ_54 [Mycobacterium phage Taj]ADU15927.1 hypothetical protein PBI_WEE_53 [Mycobacterium phage Wee]AER47799.1 hypothetical protein DEADP_56 [Mycobacterium phage DeadP]AFO10178.1 hypothetical protein TAJ_54 [Mycobacterium phage Taj]